MDEHVVEMLGHLEEGGLTVSEFLNDFFGLFNEVEGIVEETDFLGESCSFIGSAGLDELKLVNEDLLVGAGLDEVSVG